jgi:hypothetical protein
MKNQSINRRQFLRRGATLAVGTPLLLRNRALFAAETNLAASKPLPASLKTGAKVAIVQCRSYGPGSREAFAKSFDLLGGLGSLVKNKTVTVKLNLTATNSAQFLAAPWAKRMTHDATVLALTSQLFAAGAARPPGGVHAEQSHARFDPGARRLGRQGAWKGWARSNLRTREIWARANATLAREDGPAATCFPRLISTTPTKKPM